MRTLTRRKFVKLATAFSASGPFVITGSKTWSDEKIVGEGDFKFRVKHHWPQLPEKYHWQITHNVAIDSNRNLYVIHEGHLNKKDHPSIFVFDSTGKFVRAFGQQFQGGGHGIEVRKEGSEEFLYVCAYQSIKTFAKLTTKGETVWQKFVPMEAGVYAADEAKSPAKVWGRDRFLPTNFAFLDDGGFLLADGYGSFYIHRYDKNGEWVSCFGGQGKEDGKFNTPHGIWIDRRDSSKPSIVVCDRANHRLQWFDMEGKHLRSQSGFGLPANIDSFKDYLLVPELHARISILDRSNQPVAQLGADVKRVTSKGGKFIRNHEAQWQDGKFIHPHDACFDPDGNIYVAEWVNTGRVTRLERI